MAGRPKTRARRAEEAARKPLTGKKPKKRVAAKKRSPAKKAAKKAAAKREPEKKAATPRGPRLTAAAAGLRDSLIAARIAQGFTWEEAAGEAGISVTSARDAVANRRKVMPIQLNMDPAEIVERAFEGFMLSVADFERMAAEAARKDLYSVAVGAKRSANDAREKVLALLQVVGRLPEDLGDLRHLVDLRRIAQQMLDAVARFTEEVEAGADPQEAARQLRETFNELVGIKEEQQLPTAA